MLTIRNLTKTVGGRTLFQNASLGLQWGERAALVGPNGAGKSTLFHMILGEEHADEGEIDRDEYALVGYLPQEISEIGDETVLEIAMGVDDEMVGLLRTMRKHEAAGTLGDPAYAKAQDQFNLLNGYQLEPKAKKILAGLAFRQEDFNRKLTEMSGGWVMRAHLARLLVMEPDLLMLDEPTNHLDLLTLLWFQNHLANYHGAVLIISHDRDFMDAVVESVIEIDEERFISYTGNYSSYQTQREARYEQQLKAYRNQKKEIEKVESFIDQFRSVASKASQVQSRIKSLEKLERIPKPKPTRKVFKFNFPQPVRSTRKVIELENVAQSYGDLQVYKNLNLTIERGEQTVLVGPNGAGKSTLLKILAGIIPIDAGKRTVGLTTQIGYFSQHRSDGLDPSSTVLDEVLNSNAELREEDARSVLGSFLFRRADVMKRVKVLSGGEKSRLSLVKFLVNPPNLLLMDEPTTHLDIVSVEALIVALQQFQGTLVFISHDVHFIRSLAKRTLHVGGGEVAAYDGGFDYYLEKTGAMDDARGAITAGMGLENAQPGR